MSLSNRINAIGNKNSKLVEFLKSALEYQETDFHSCLTKCRIVLEKILFQIYTEEMGQKPSKGMIGQILSDKNFTAKIPQSIRARINMVKDIANLGPHGSDEITANDTLLVLQEIIYTTEWYLATYQQVEGFISAEIEYLEILPELRKKYRNYLRPKITSVRIGQGYERCLLEITEAKGELDEIISRTDLGFISGDEFSEYFFDPKDNITINAKRLINEFDEIGIINCTDLFTEAASTWIYEYWSKNGNVPDPTNYKILIDKENHGVSR